MMPRIHIKRVEMACMAEPRQEVVMVHEARTAAYHGGRARNCVRREFARRRESPEDRFIDTFSAQLRDECQVPYRPTVWPTGSMLGRRL